MASQNVPPSKVAGGALWGMAWFGTRIAHTDDFDGNYRNLFYLMGSYNASLSPTHNRVLKPEEAWNIDSKVDDGKPRLGKVRSRKSTFMAGCVSSDVGATAEYVLTSDTTACTLNFASGF